jgi:hypothetical protein
VRPTRSIALAARVVGGSVWGVAFVVLGLWLLLEGATRVPERISLLAGAASVAAGLYLFMFVVADRLFPAAAARLSIWVLEMATFLVFLGGFAGAVMAYRGALQ